MTGIRGRYAVVATLLGVLGGAIFSSALGASGAVHSLSPALMAAGKTAHLMPCGQGASPIGFVARLSDADSGNALEAAGFRVTTGRSIDPSAPPTAIVGLRKADGTPVDLRDLDSVHGVLGAGAVFPQSSDPALRSCSYRLQDRPQALRLVSAAEAALASSGAASRQQMEGSSAVYLVSDNPLDPSQVIVTIDVPGTGTTLPSGQGEAFNTVSLEALVDRPTLHVAQIAVPPND